MTIESVFLAFADAVEEELAAPTEGGGEDDGDDEPPRAQRVQMAFCRGLCAMLDASISPKGRAIIRRTAEKIRAQGASNGAV